MGPYYIPHLKELQVIIDFLAWEWSFFQKSGFLSDLDFWKLSLEGQIEKIRPLVLQTDWVSVLQVTLFFLFSASNP